MLNNRDGSLKEGHFQILNRYPRAELERRRGVYMSKNAAASVKKHTKKMTWYLLLMVFGFLFFAPLLWMISTSLKDASSVFVYPPQWIPEIFRWENYAEVFRRIPILQYLKNTLVVAIVPVFGQLISTPMVAYSITKIDWKGGKVIFPLILGTMMIPWQVTQIPMFSTWSRLGFVNTFIPLLLPSFFGSPYYIYLMRQFIKGLPNSIFDAARMDGAGELRILYLIVYPLCKPVLTTIAILVFMAGWNDLNGPLLYLQEGTKYTLSIGLQTFLTSVKQEWQLLMAASAMCTVPLIVIFFIGQKYFLTGISTTSGLK